MKDILSWLAGVVLILGLGVAGGWWLRGGQVAKAQSERDQAIAGHAQAVADGLKKELEITEASNKLVTAAEKKAAETRATIKWRIKEVQTNVPNVLTPKVDASFPMSDAFVCLLNQAAACPDPDCPQTPRSACEPSDRPSPLAASDVARGVINWEAMYYEARAQIKATLDFYKAQQKIFNGE